MATEAQFLEAIKQSLEDEGHMPKLRAEIRSKIIMMLNTDPNVKKVPKMSDEVLLINELIREYFNWIGYQYSASTLTAEAKMNITPPPHESLVKWLGMDYEICKSDQKDCNESALGEMPLLFAMLLIAKK